MKLAAHVEDPSARGAARPALYLLLSFLIPFILILAALAGLRIAPFGDKTLVISDANGLYINTLAYAGRMFRGLEGIAYSFEKGLGGNMTGHLNGILLTPFSFLFALSDVSNYPAAFSFVSALSMSLCGLTMYLFLADVYGHKRSNLLFSTSYALIGFNVANVFQACFFMAAPVLPVMVLGLRRLLRGRSPLIYILALTYALCTSFYFGFVLCVASVLFFFTGLWLYRDELRGKKLRLFVNYALASLCGGLLACALWLPSLLSIQGGRLDQTKVGDILNFGENMPFLEIGAKLFTGAHSTSELVNGLPNIFVGVLPLALAVLFFLSKEIDRRKKAAAGFLLGFYLLSFWFVALNMLMHGGTNTNWFNYRYSYVFSFLLLLLAAELWQKLDGVTGRDMKRCLVGMLLVTAVVFTQKYEFLKGGAILLDFAILLLIWLAWRMHKNRPEVNKRSLFELIALLLVCVNLFLNYRICIKNVDDWQRSASDYETTVNAVDPLVQGIKTAETDFFRMEINRQRSGTAGNDPMLYGYDGVGHGGSNERNFVRKELNELGIPWYDMRSYYADGVPAATDALLGVKYVIAEEDLTAEKAYEKKISLEDWSIYLNPDALSVAILSGNGIDGVETDASNVFANLNAVWAALSGRDTPVFTEEDDIAFTAHAFSVPADMTSAEARELVEKYDRQASASTASAQASAANTETDGSGPPQFTSYIEYTFTASCDGYVYVYNRGALSDVNGATENTVKALGWHQAGDTITGYLSNGTFDRVIMEEYCGRFRAAYADADALHELSELVKARPVTIEKESETHLTGAFTAEAGQTLLFTIPWDEGWTLYIDGAETPMHQALGVFLAADAPVGTPSYERKYVPPGLRVGLIVSAAALLLTLVYLAVGRKWIDRLLPEKAAETAREEPAADETETKEETPESGEEEQDDPV